MSELGYKALLDSIQRADSGLQLYIPANWMQGRTTYGGLSAALCLEAIKREHPDLPPLRSTQVNFIGPAGGDVRLESRILRQGKSTAFIETSIIGDQGLATQSIFCFGKARESKLDADFTAAPECPGVEESEDFFKLGPGPVFTGNFDCRLAKGGFPFGGSDQHDHYIWIRFKEDVEHDATALLAIGDMPPPAVLPMFKEFAPISSMNWAVNFLRENPKTDDGWWLTRTRAEQAKDGYSSQDMQVWNSDLDLVMTGRQSVAIFY